jgi:hypothetical protein
MVALGISFAIPLVYERRAGYARVNMFTAKNRSGAVNMKFMHAARTTFHLATTWHGSSKPIEHLARPCEVSFVRTTLS